MGRDYVAKLRAMHLLPLPLGSRKSSFVLVIDLRTFLMV